MTMLRKTARTRGLSRVAAAMFAAVLAGGAVVSPRPALADYDDPEYPEADAEATSGSVGAGDGVVTVDLTKRLRFDKPEIRVKPGTTVVWRNVSSIAHTVTADPARAKNRRNVALPAGVAPFGSGALKAGQTFRYTFTKPGVYKYICLPHETYGMLGTVVVG